jgi:hypothetical protein
MNKKYGNYLDNYRVFRGLPLAHPAGIFIEGNIQGPVPGVLETPMAPHGMTKADGVIG